MKKEELQKLVKKGLTYQEIGDKFNVSRQRIHQVLKDIKTVCYYGFTKKIKKQYFYAVFCSQGEMIAIKTHVGWSYMIYKTKKEATFAMKNSIRHDGYEKEECDHKQFVKKIHWIYPKLTQ